MLLGLVIGSIQGLYSWRKRLVALRAGCPSKRERVCRTRLPRRVRKRNCARPVRRARNKKYRSSDEVAATATADAAYDDDEDDDDDDDDDDDEEEEKNYI